MKDTLRLRSSFIARNQDQLRKSVTEKVEKIIKAKQKNKLNLQKHIRMRCSYAQSRNLLPSVH